MTFLCGQTVLYFISCGLAAAGLLLVIIGVATPEWTVLEINTYVLKSRQVVGLWRSCIDGECEDIKGSKSASLETCEAFGLLSIFAGAGCLGVLLAPLFLHCLNIHGKGWIARLAPVAGLTSALFVIITASVWGGKHYKDVQFMYLGYSFILPLVGGGLLPLAGLLGYLTVRYNNS